MYRVESIKSLRLNLMCSMYGGHSLCLLLLKINEQNTKFNNRQTTKRHTHYTVYRKTTED